MKLQNHTPLQILAAAVLVVLLNPLVASAEKAAIFSAKGKAIAGYDPVAYFLQGKPIKGSDAHTVDWNGATWAFSSADNLAKFKGAPQKYAPQYGGYCAWAVSQGYTAKIDPKNWKIVDGKLYLNYNSKIQKKWEKDISGNIAAANGHWPTVLKK